ncbi:MAG: hypothetical protein ABI604_15160, partial [Nitrospirota bacterium]
MRRTRSNHAPGVKAKVALAAIKGDTTLAELAEAFAVRQNQISEWKQPWQEAHELFRDLHGSITKLLHQLLHNLFYLGSGTAAQKYSGSSSWRVGENSMRNVGLS